MSNGHIGARARWSAAFVESATLAVDSLRTQPARSTLAIVGIVIGIVTVVLVASVLAGVRNSVAELFRDLGTENVFAFHLTGDPYTQASDREARRRPLKPAFARDLARLGGSIRDVGVQVIVPPVINGRALTARAGSNESDTVLVEGSSNNLFEITGAEIAAGRPFTELEDRTGAPVAVIGANVAKALYGEAQLGRTVGKSFALGGDIYFVAGELAPRKGGFFGENRGDNVIAIPLGTAARRFPQAENTVLYVRARPGERETTRAETEFILRRLRGLAPGDANDFNLSTSDQIIAQFDRLSAVVGLVTIGLAAVSLFIGGIGIANVMVISVTERTREIGVRIAIGARRREVQRQFLLEATLLSAIGGAAGLVIALSISLLIESLAPGFSAGAPLWVIVAGLVSAIGTGIVAGYWPARRAAALDPIDALRYE